MRAHDLGKTVALVERGQVGGAGVFHGALSSKTLWHLSNDYARATRADRGYRLSGCVASYPDVQACVLEAVRERQHILQAQLDALERPNARGGRVTLVRGDARFIAPHEVRVVGTGGTGGTGDARVVHAKYFMIATGSSPRVPDGIEVDGERVLTSDHLEDLPEFPESLLVVGAGVVGCEYATAFANFGKTKIFILDRQPRILPFEDDDIAGLIAQNFEQSGVTIHRESKLVSLRRVGDRVEYVMEGPTGATETRTVERALVSTGRVPNTGNLGLEDIGVAREKNGSLVATDTQTTVPHIYAAGDVTMDVALVNIAELEGRYAVESMFGEAPAPIHYEALSAIMFLKPEVASVGLNETAAKKKGVRYRVGVVHNSLVARNIAMRATDGFIKLVAEYDAPHRILGLRVVGPQAASTIQGVAFLIASGATLSDLEHCVHPHPAIPEGVQECARLILGRSVLKPEVFGARLRVGDG
jgi:dihydrolipoamide dehydrogenase